MNPAVRLFFPVAVAAALAAAPSSAQEVDHRPLFERFEQTCRNAEPASLSTDVLRGVGWTPISGEDWPFFAEFSALIAEMQATELDAHADLRAFRDSGARPMRLMVVNGSHPTDGGISNCFLEVEGRGYASILTQLSEYLGRPHGEASEGQGQPECVVRRYSWPAIWADRLTVSLDYFPGSEPEPGCEPRDMLPRDDGRIRSPGVALSAWGMTPADGN